MESSFFSSVIENHVKTAGHGNQELLQRLMRMSASLGAAGHVIEIVDPPDIERNVLAALNEREIAPRIMDRRKLNKRTRLETVTIHFFWVPTNAI